MAFLTASVVIANSGGAASNDSGAFDSGATGRVFGNNMNVSNSASGVTDGGNNGFIGT